MAILQVKKFGEDILYQKSEKVEEFNDELKKTVDDMLETMYAENGIGLAAVQVGILKKIIVIDLNNGEDFSKITMINAEVIEEDGIKKPYKEGCLSVPEIQGVVKRSNNIKVKYQDLEGNEKITEAKDLMAICMQHEIDHTNGILFIDRYDSKMMTMLAKEKLTKNRKKNKK